MADAKHDHIQHYQIRPRFRNEIDSSPDQIKDSLEKALGQNENEIYGNVIEGHATLNIPKKDQHYWSPQLSLSFEQLNEGSVLRGMYSPRPEVWTMFVLFYSFIGFAVLIISIIGYSNWSLGQPAQILWLVPLLTGIFLTLYLVSFFGQKMGKKQMIILHDFVEEALGIQIIE